MTSAIADRSRSNGKMAGWIAFTGRRRAAPLSANWISRRTRRRSTRRSQKRNNLPQRRTKIIIYVQQTSQRRIGGRRQGRFHRQSPSESHPLRRYPPRGRGRAVSRSENRAGRGRQLALPDQGLDRKRVV